MQNLLEVLEKVVDVNTYDPNESRDCKQCFGIGLVRIIGTDPITKRKITCSKSCDCEKGRPYHAAYSKAVSKG